MHAQELDQFYALLDEAVQKFFGCGIISAKSHYLVPCLALDEKLVLTIRMPRVFTPWCGSPKSASRLRFVLFQLT